MIDQLLEGDRKLFLLVNGLSGSWLDYLFAWPTFLGLGSVVIVLIFIFMLIWDKEAMFKKFLALIFFLLTLGIVTQVLKKIVTRPRPYGFFYPQIAEGKASVNCIFEMGTASSWPSGHAATVFAAAILLNYFYNQRLVFLYPLAFLVAFTRIYTGAHFPSDVIAGILIGILWGLISIGLIQKIKVTEPSLYNGHIG